MLTALGKSRTATSNGCLFRRSGTMNMNRIFVRPPHQAEAMLICAEFTQRVKNLQISVTEDQHSARWSVVLLRDGIEDSFIVDGPDPCTQLRSKLQERL